MTRALRLLVITEQGPVREFQISRTRLWIGAMVLALGFGTTAAVGYVLGGLGRHRSPPENTVRPVLGRGLTLRASVLAEASLKSSPVVVGGCGPEMILVEGKYCPALIQRCQTQIDPDGSALHGHRCAEYKRSSSCLSPQKQQLRFCIDRDEHVEAGASLPQSRVTAAEARATCERYGKRLCSNAEWTFACESEDSKPYPYGTVRDSTACNIDRTEQLVTASGELMDLRVPPGRYPRCQSAFGVRDLSGNVEEYVVDESTGRTLRKGGYWQPGANHCRASQPHSDQSYRGIELGFRCCADPPAGHA